MLPLSRYKNRIIAKLSRHVPVLAGWFTDRFSPLESQDVPWTPVRKPLVACKVAMITTAGVHHKNQPPFDMIDREGDPSFRKIDASPPLDDLVITHDYYDHSDADKDINLVFPIQRLWELEQDGQIGQVATTHYGFMGHIIDRHIQTLTLQTAPQVGRKLKSDDVDLVLLFPG